jgi:osmotically-inducible protein OsmY
MKQPRKGICAIFLGISLATAMGCAATLPNQSAGEYLDDAVVTAKVKASMIDQPSLKASEIRVETFKGTVYLSGLVSSQAQMDKAGEVARSIKGVRAVKNELRLR